MTRPQPGAAPRAPHQPRAGGGGAALSRRAVISASVAAAAPALAIAATGTIGAATGDAEMVGEGAAAAAITAGGGDPRTVPARPLPVPKTVSPALQERIAAPYPPGWDAVPADAAGWRALAEQSARDVAPFLPGIVEGFGLTVERRSLGGVPVFDITPAAIPEAHAGRVLLHLHGGGYVFFPGEAGAGEGMLMAGLGGFRVISVDYRMAPDHPFPAALDDAVAAWRALTEQHDPRRMAVFGSSAGGALTLALILRCRAAGLPLPAAIAPGTPAADARPRGDSRHANAFIDNVLVADSGWAGAAIRLYAGAADLDHPHISPVLGDFAGFPPAILTTGTRDLFLSDTVRVHRKLRAAGVEAALQVFEGQSHAQYLDPTIPEAQEAFAEITAFFDRHLG